MWFFSFASGPPGSGQKDFGVSGHIFRVFPSASPMLSQPESTGFSFLWENLPPKGEHLLDKLSQVLTEGFAAGPLALSVAVERVGAGGLFVGRAAEEEKGPSDGTAVMLRHSHVQGQPSGTHGRSHRRSHSNGPLSSMGTRAQRNSDKTYLCGGLKPGHPQPSQPCCQPCG